MSQCFRKLIGQVGSTVYQNRLLTGLMKCRDFIANRIVLDALATTCFDNNHEWISINGGDQASSVDPWS